MAKVNRATVAVGLIVIAALLIYAFTSGLIGGGGIVQGKGGAATLSFTVKFTDGTSQTFETSNIYTGQLSVVPLSLYVGGKQIAEIDVDVKVKLNTGGRTVESWNVQIAQRIEVYKSGQSTPLTSSTGNFNPSGTTWADGETKTVLTTPLTASVIENAIKQYSGDGDFYFQVVAQVTLTVNTNDGTYQLSGSGVGGINITMRNYSAMSMSVIVSVNPLTTPP